jgi:hypothetical protein
LCASSFFRGRHQQVAMFKTGRRKGVLCSKFAERCEAARDYIRLARAAGFRGTFIQAAEEWRNHQDRAVMAREGGALARLEAR